MRAECQATTAPEVATSTSAPSQTRPEPSPEEKQRARRLFTRGVELASEGAYSRAAQKFGEALAIVPAPAVEYNLASALFEMHRFDDSYNAVSHVLATPDVSAEVRARAEKLEQTLRPRVARLTVVLGGSSQDSVIMVDGVELDPSQIGVTRAVPAGRHKVEAVRAGNLISAREIEIPLRTAALVDVSMIPSAEREVIREVIVSSEPEPLVQPEQREADKPWSRSVGLWAGVAAVVIAAGVTTTVLLMGKDEGAKEEKPVSGNLEPGVITWR